MNTNEKRYNSLLNNLDAGIVVHAADTSIITCNDRASELLGLSIDQMTGKKAIDPAWKFLDENNKAIPVENYPVNLLLRDKKSFKNKIAKVIRPSKDHVWLSVSGTVEYADDGTIHEFLISFIDITKNKEAELELKYSNQIFESIVHNTADLLMTQKNGGQVDYISPQCLNILGYTQEEMKKLDPGQHIHPDDREVTLQKQSDAFQGSDIVEFEYRFLHKNGNYVWLRHSASPIIIEEKISKVISTVRDITETKKKEEVLIESEERYRLLYEGAGLGIGYFAPDGTVISFNSIASKNLNGERSEFFNKNIFDLFPKEEAKEYFSRIQKAITCDNIAEYEDLVHVQDKDIWFLSTYSKIVNSRQEIMGVQVIFQDITNIKHIQNELKLSRDKLQFIIDNLQIGYWEYYPETKKSLWSEGIYKISGLEMNNELVSYELVKNFIHKKDWKKIEKVGRLAVEKGLPFNIFITAVRSDGEERLVNTQCKPIVSDSGKISHLYGISQDVTHINETNQERQKRIIELIYLNQKDKLVNKLKEICDHLAVKYKFDYHDNKLVNSLIRSYLSETQEWEIFKEKFQSIHPDFFKKLLNINPSLTQYDLRLSAYIKLNYSTLEIARINNVKNTSVQIARVRLKKKLRLPEQTNLIRFLQNL